MTGILIGAHLLQEKATSEKNDTNWNDQMERSGN